MKKKNIHGIQNNLIELKEKLNPDYLINDTIIFRKGGKDQEPEDIKKSISIYINSWIIPLINDTIDKSLDK